MWDNFRHFSHHKHVYELKSDLKQFLEFSVLYTGGGGYFLVKRLLGMCRWMGSHFHNWFDYNGVIFLVELLEWGRTFSGFLG